MERAVHGLCCLALTLAAAGGCSAIVDPNGGQLGAPGLDAGDVDSGAVDSSVVDSSTPTDAAVDTSLPADAAPDAEPPDGGPPPPSDAAPPSPDAAPEPLPGTVACGATRCGRGDGCCVPEGGDAHCFGRASGRSCECDGVLCETVEIRCDGPEDCMGDQLCCADKGITDDFFGSTTCARDCSRSLFGEQREVCHPGDGVACVNGTSCEESESFPDGFFLCGVTP